MSKKVMRLEMVLLVDLGLRWSEIANLTWDNIGCKLEELTKEQNENQ